MLDVIAVLRYPLSSLQDKPDSVTGKNLADKLANIQH